MTYITKDDDVFKKIPDNQPGYYNWVGKESHYLTVVDAYMRVTEGKLRQRYFMCKCKCGNEKLVHGDGIRKQRIKSCGCWKSEVDAAKAKTMGDSNLTHGLSKSRIYKIWDSMMYRCYNTNDESYENYGGRGIKVSEKWHKFDSFYEDMSEGYNENMTIDRINVNGNYEKSNCRWLTMFDQQGNKRNTVRITHDGKNQTLKQWSEETGISVSALYQRFTKGYSPEEILKKDRRTTILLTLNGETHSIKDWSKITGLSERLIRSRYEKDWPDKKILTLPKNSRR